MNELIQELAMQANDETGNLFDLNHKELNVFLEKFAKLIVKDCAKIASNADLEDVDGGDSAVLRAASEQIKEHFGVEE